MTALIERIAARFPDAIASSHSWRGDQTVVLHPANLLEVARFLRDEPDLAMNLLVDLSAVDYSAFGKGPQPAFFGSSGVKLGPSLLIPDESPWPGPPGKDRFAVVYHFYSTTLKHRLRLVVTVPEEAPEVDSLCPLWPGANWLERETWDMFGVAFKGHPDLRRILMYDEFEGHPLRKDYPVNKRQPLIGPVN